jgi:hypothetical protein
MTRHIESTPMADADVTRGLVESLEMAAPGIALGVLAALDEDDLTGLSAPEALATLTAWERVLGWAAVSRARAVRAVAQRIVADRGPSRGTLMLDQEISEELALALRIAPRTAAAQVSFAEGLELLPRATIGLLSGTLGLPHAHVLVDLLTSDDPALDDELRGTLERQLVSYAASSSATPGQLRRRGQQLLLTVDPDGARKRRERARRRRDVSLRPDEHGMAWLSAYLPAEVAHTCFGLIDTHARTTMVTDPDDDRVLGARRADALVDRLLSGALDGNPPNDAAPTIGRDVRINVTVPISVLAGVDDGPGHIAGYGAIDADHVRELAFGDDTTWRRLLTDPVSDTLLDVGTTRYRPPARLERQVRLRDVTCRWPGCQVAAQRCDLDHTVPFPKGPTSDDNLVALCRRHHRLKTLAGFETKQSFGVWQVTTPTGRVIARGAPTQTAPGVFRMPPVMLA